MSNILGYKDIQTGNTGPSRSIWNDWDALKAIRDPGYGVEFWDDFCGHTLPAVAPVLTTQVQVGGGYKGFASATAVVGPSVAQGAFGVLTLYLNGTAAEDEAASIATAAQPFIIGGTTPTKKLWFECRIKLPNVNTLGTNFFIGLGECSLCTLAAIVPIVAAGTPVAATSGLVGFFKPEANLTTFDFIYADRTTAVTPAAGTFSYAASTWTKIGFTYDSSNTASIFTLYQDGVVVAQDTAVTLAVWAALSNIDTNPLGLIAAVHEGTGHANTDAVYMDWWRCAQLR